MAHTACATFAFTLCGKAQGCNPARIRPSQGRFVDERFAEICTWQRSEDAELVETHERQVAELQKSLAEVSAAAAAAEAQDRAAQQAAVDRQNEHDMEVRERVWRTRLCLSQHLTVPDCGAPNCGCTVCEPALPRKIDE